jgi:hypothetical protein
MPADPSPVVSLSVTDLLTFLKVQRCPRFLRLKVARNKNSAAVAGTRDSFLDFSAAQAGARHENLVLHVLTEAFGILEQPPSASHARHCTPASRIFTPWEDLCTHMLLAEQQSAAAFRHATRNKRPQPLLWREVEIRDTQPVNRHGKVLPIKLRGRIDFLIFIPGHKHNQIPAASATNTHQNLKPSSDTTRVTQADSGVQNDDENSGIASPPALVIVECKSGSQINTSHYLQLACYTLLLRSLLLQHPGLQHLAQHLQVLLLTPPALQELQHKVQAAAAGEGGGEARASPAAAAPPAAAAVASDGGWGLQEEQQQVLLEAFRMIDISSYESDIEHLLEESGQVMSILRAAGARSSAAAGAGGGLTAAAAAASGVTAACGADTGVADTVAVSDIEDFSLGGHCRLCPAAIAHSCLVGCHQDQALQLAGATGKAVQLLSGARKRGLGVGDAAAAAVCAGDAPGSDAPGPLLKNGNASAAVDSAAALPLLPPSAAADGGAADGGRNDHGPVSLSWFASLTVDQVQQLQQSLPELQQDLKQIQQRAKMLLSASGPLRRAEIDDGKESWPGSDVGKGGNSSRSAALLSPEVLVHQSCHISSNLVGDGVGPKAYVVPVLDLVSKRVAAVAVHFKEKGACTGEVRGRGREPAAAPAPAAAGLASAPAAADSEDVPLAKQCRTATDSTGSITHTTWGIEAQQLTGAPCNHDRVLQSRVQLVSRGYHTTAFDSIMAGRVPRGGRGDWGHRKAWEVSAGDVIGRGGELGNVLSLGVSGVSAGFIDDVNEACVIVESFSWIWERVAADVGGVGGGGAFGAAAAGTAASAPFTSSISSSVCWTRNA